ncbi:MAG: hypothetical protein ACK5RT_20585, partial [Dolichospermum sp.]
KCSCGCELHRDTNAAVNILNLAKNRGGHPQINATGVEATTLLGASLEKPSFDDECRIPSALARGVSIQQQVGEWIEYQFSRFQKTLPELPPGC